MARYWRNQPNLTISNIAPGSTVGVWTLDDEEMIDEEMFIGRVFQDELEVATPTDEVVLVRIRKVELKTFETKVRTSEHSEICHVHIRDL